MTTAQPASAPLAPPSYENAAQDPAVDELADEFQLNLNLDTDTVLPTEDEALVHLRLLHAFYNLRTSISRQNGLFGFYNEDVTVPLSETTTLSGEARETLQKSLLTTIEEKRWAVFVTRAVDRFSAWLAQVEKPYLSQPLTWGAMKSNSFSTMLDDSGEKHTLSRTALPPLDVLMVWHAYMLNPRCYLEDRLRRGSSKFWKVKVPWELINNCIDNLTEEYNPDSETKETFESATGYKWSNLEGKDTCTRTCPNQVCRKRISFPYTGIQRLDITNWVKECAFNGISDMPAGNGYADPKLNMSCPECHDQFDHDYLRAAKFNTDVLKMFMAQNNEDREPPMPGLILNMDGRAAKFEKHTETRTFPHHLLKLSDDVTYRPNDCRSLETLRSSIESGLRDRATLLMALKGLRGRQVTNARIYIRRMMSRYWGNSSEFALDLVGAVIRQGGFIEKMENIDWLHSPTAKSTMSRLIEKYRRFFHIMASNPDKLIVPTLDVDLAWHTHQLSPVKYYNYSVKTTRTKFIDHDDKVSETSLNTAFAETSKIYQRLYNEPYSLCTCWYCESIRASHDSGVSRLMNRSSISSSEDSLYNPSKGVTSDPEKGPHVSAHNAIRPQLPRVRFDGKDGYETRLRATEKELVAAYEKACKRAKKAGRPMPQRPPFMDRRRDAADASAYYWYPFGVYPLVIPYYGYACDPNVYASNPGCANMCPGAAGNCAAGSCGGGVAAGACGAGGAAGWGGPGACGGGGAAGGGAACAGGGGFGGCGGGGGGCGGGGGGGCGGGGGG